MRTVAKYENDSWTKLGGPTGGLTSTRYGHNAIWLDDELFIIGGHQTRLVRTKAQRTIPSVSRF